MWEDNVDLVKFQTIGTIEIIINDYLGLPKVLARWVGNLRVMMPLWKQFSSSPLIKS